MWVINFLRWFFGVMMILGTTGVVSVSVISSVASLLMGLLLIPPIERKLFSILASLKKPLIVSRRIKIILFIVLFFIYFVGIGTSQKVPMQIAQPSSVTSSPTPTLQQPLATQEAELIKVTVTPTVTIKITVTPTPTVQSLGSGKCTSVNGMPDSKCTPGSIDPRVTQDNLTDTICKSGYTTTVRPSTTYTNNLKAQQIIEYGYTDTRLSSYEEDHLIPLELGGAPSEPKNLWPEYGSIPNPKDTVENGCKKKVCAGTITLAAAQHEISTNWRTACGYNVTVTATLKTTTITTAPTAAPAATSPTTNNTGGATGICVDGTYTYAVNHQGACSHHGGVRSWY